jgi:hypothetical protein
VCLDLLASSRLMSLAEPMRTAPARLPIFSLQKYE